MIKVSVITVCKNSEKTIERTIQSVLEQTYSDIEYIIVDGVSTDGTLDIIKKYKVLFGDRMKYVSEPDKGLYDAMNKGIRMATGTVIGIVNSDDYYEKDAVENVVNAYHKSCEEFSSKMGGGGYDKRYQVFYGIVRVIENDIPQQLYWRAAEFVDDGTMMHPAMFVTRDVYKKFGGYSQKYRITADYDFELRTIKSGKVKYVPIEKILSNFSTGGVSSALNTQVETNQLQYRYGCISKRTYLTRKIIFCMQKLYRKILGN